MAPADDRETQRLEARVLRLNQRVEELTAENARSRASNGLALEDWLLGLPNRRAFDQRLHQECARTRRSGFAFAVAMIDVDGLKRINDAKGHAAGDAALLSVAGSLRARLRQVDFLARWGGDEFAVILPHTNHSGAEQALGRIQTLLDERPEPDLSFSFGVAAERSSIEDSALVRDADAAMYRSKTLRTQRARRGARSPARVLLAEDDLELRRLLAGELRKAGYEVQEAGTGFELLRQLGDLTLRNLAIDLIVSDIQMPGLNGLVVVEGLRKQGKPDSVRTPVMLMTAFGDAKAHAEAKRLGAVIFNKPFELEDFRACALNLVGPVLA